MKKSNVFFMFFCLLTFILCGCWDSQDIEGIFIPIVGGYDIKGNDEADYLPELVVSGVFPIFEPDAVSSATVGTTYSTTIGGSRTERALRTPQTLIFGMLQAAVYGEDLAKKGFSDYCDILLRNPQVKLNIYVAIAEGEVKGLFDKKITNYSNTGKYIVDLLKNAPKDSLITNLTLHELSVSFYCRDVNVIIPVLKPIDNGVAIDGVGILKGDQLIAKTNVDEAQTLSFLRGNEAKGFMPFYGRGHEAGSIRVMHHSRKVKVKRIEDRYIFNIDISIKGSMVEFFQKEPLTENHSEIEKIENSIKKNLEKKCDEFINKMQSKYKVDCIDITRFAAAKWRNELEKMDMESFINNAKINVNVNVDIIKTGELE